MGAKILKNLTNEELKKVEADLVLLLQRHRAEQSCWEFFKQAWHVLEPFDYEYNWHHEYFCELFQALVESPNKEKLLINIPPRHLKSLIFSVVGPAWVWTSRPHLSFICSSFSGNLSTSLSIKRRDLIQSSWYQTRWGSRFTIKDDQNTKEKFKNDKNGNNMP